MSWLDQLVRYGVSELVSEFSKFETKKVRDIPYCATSPTGTLQKVLSY